MAKINPFANFVDKVATKVHAPEIGLSELLNKGNATANTGRVAFSGPAGSAGQVAFNSATPLSTASTPIPRQAPGQQFDRTLGMIGPVQPPQPAPMTQYDHMLADFKAQLASEGSGGSAADDRLPSQILIGPDGQPYDVSIPEQRQTYVGLQRAKAATMTAQQEQDYLAEISRTMAESASQYADRATALDENSRTLDQKKIGLNESFDQGNSERASAFMQAGPNAFQSAQAADQGVATAKLGEATNDITHQQNLIGETKTGLASKYDQYVQTLKGDTQKNIEQIRQGGYDEANDVINKVAPYDVQDGTTDFATRYGTSPFTAPDPTVGDAAVASASPFLSFGALPGQSGATSANPFANLAGRASSLDDDAARKKDANDKEKFLYA